MKLRDELDALEKAAVQVRKTKVQIVKDAEVDKELESVQWIIDANERDAQKKSSG